MPSNPSRDHDADRRADNPPAGGAGDTNSAPAPHPSDGVMDRRTGLDRRDMHEFAQSLGAAGADDFTGLERRRGPGRRRTDYSRAAEEGEMTAEQFLFVSAVEAFKRANGKMFPTWTDVLEVVRLLGYRKTMPSELTLRGAEDWREKPDAPSGVRAKPGHPEMERRRHAA
jgi:hypothetical protein